MYHKGLYHLFYQYNPFGPLWRKNITWAHSVSHDLINWAHLDHALHPIDSFDINGCWSGSITFLDGNNPVILYTGIDSQDRQVQNLAVPKNLSDPLLTEWSKSPHNPLMIPTNGLKPDLFRDPTTAWLGPDKIWRVIVGAEIDGKGMAILYKSRDFVKWNRTNNPLHSSAKSIMWECPDFFPVSLGSTNGVDFSYDQDQSDIKHFLKVSFNSRDYYILGKYDPKTDDFVVESDFLDAGSDLRLDYGKFYASKSFYDSAKKRRILWSWVNESDSDADSVKKGWSGLQFFPRSMVLSESGRQLIQWPIKEIEKLRSNEVDLQYENLKGGSVFEISGVTASQADVEVTFDVEGLEYAELFDTSWVDPQLLCSQKNASVGGKVGPFGLLVLASNDLTEQTAIFFHVFRSSDKYVVLMCSDQSRSSLWEGLDKTTYGAFVDLDPSKEKITLRSLIDHSIVESFGGEGRTCITARVYPKMAIDKEAHLYAFNYGSESITISKLGAWSMKSAQFVSMEKMSGIWVIGVLFSVLFSHGTEASYHGQRSSHYPSSQGQPYRTAFHFQPPKNWMNGPMYYKGVYHLFYQYNPDSAVWGNITWAHSISFDLVNWIHLDIALNPTDPYDINGCWSGSATILPGEKPAILYTGSDTRKRQVQNLAVPKNLSDSFLTEWLKSPNNPSMSPVDDIDPDLFRDPTTAWRGPDGIWRVIVGAQIDGKGMAILYKSRDFVKWNRTKNPLHSSTKTKMWECPDFYPVGVNTTDGKDHSADQVQDQFNTKYVLKASFHDQDHYVVGKYVPKTDAYEVESDFLDAGLDLRYDYGKFYASKTFYDSAKKRRILWGWVTESDTQLDDKNKGWSGLQSIPRSIVLGKSGRQLVQWPIKEIEKLRRKEVFNLHDKELKGGSVFEVSGVMASQADVEVSVDVRGKKKVEIFDPSWADPQLLCSQKNVSVRGKVGPFGLFVLASKDLTEQTAIFFRLFRSSEKYVVLMCSDQSR
ncbi:hypothetical protein TIFTF001_049071 [Ficus carica]|uniref:Uncharacterized protein n=1 Tax=Ficus carica TaxID=3494 RepID=A0AA87YUA3_FICCA|nr:hypothetical protein TIFTF001_049071 [Ficus carica]